MNKDLRKRTVGEDLWMYRKWKGLTATQMAKKLGVGRTTYWTWERDKAEVPELSAQYHLWFKPPQSLLLTLARRRRGGRLNDTAALVGCSHVILLKREREGDPGLRTWWEKRGFIF